MRTTMTAVVAAVAGLAGCDAPPSCEKVVAHVGELRRLDDGERTVAMHRCKSADWSDDLRRCAMKAKTSDDVDACTTRRDRGRARSSDGYSAYVERSRAVEVTLRLKSLERALRTHHVEHAAYPVGEVGPTPAGSCCEGPGHKCAADAAAWRDPVWEELDFELDEASAYQYRYYSATGASAAVEATVDLDCDLSMAVYTLRCTSDDGAPTCSVDQPARGAD